MSWYSHQVSHEVSTFPGGMLLTGGILLTGGMLLGTTSTPEQPNLTADGGARSDEQPNLPLCTLPLPS
ncbi:hypothetical protein DdX_19610 [Ditylenchus destructor]|uniref:Uncharacterized protein n=1 Tax=Ditylenchus destructor TaxID=166010 RepID=A0AAD4MI42_9BILA|nr:hypothetical protein DdX_19610 [Ditylenchus destructor]